MPEELKTETVTGEISGVAKTMSLAICHACEALSHADAIGGAADALSKMLAKSAPSHEVMAKNADVIARSIMACAEVNWLHLHPEEGHSADTIRHM